MLGGLDYHSIVATVRRILGRPVVFNVMRPPFNATGLGIADDTAAIQAAIDAATAAGGGTIDCPGDHLCNTISSASGLSWALSICSSNIKIRGRPGSRIRTTAANTSILHIHGAGKTAGIANWAANEFATVGLTLYAINAAAKGDMSVTTTVAANAGNFAVGDDIFLRTGQTLTNAGSHEPDSEVNEVTSVNAGTGVLGLKYPLAKPYAPQNYPVGHPNVGTPAPFGVAKVTDRTIKKIDLRDIQLECTGGAPALIGGQIVGFNIINVDGISKNAFQSIGNYRLGLFSKNRIEMDLATNLYAFGTATGTTDVDIADNLISNRSGVPQIHIHEGSARISVHDNIIQGKAVAAQDTVIDMRQANYDIDVHDNTLIVSGTISVLIYVDSGESMGFTGCGQIRNNRMVAPGCSAAAYGIRVADSSGWVVSGNTEVGGGSWVESGNTFHPIHRVYIGGHELINGFYGSAPPFAMVQNIWPSRTLVDAASNHAGANVRIPDDWKAFEVYVYWCNLGAGAGNVTWDGAIMQGGSGDLLSGALTKAFGVAAGAVAGAQYAVVKTKLLPSGSTFVDNVTASKPCTIYVARLGADVNDTLAASIAVLGIELVRIK